MARKSNQNQPGQEAGSLPGPLSRRNEFDDAVTREIPDVLPEDFEEQRTGDAGNPFITDVSLTAYVDLENEDILPPGLLLGGRFEIVELVYAAGMSQVYKAIDRLRSPAGSGELHVAVKMMRPSIVADSEARLSLEREAAIAQSLSHPNIINIFDFDDHDRQFFLAMEWLEGESVNAMLRRTRGEGVEAGLARAVITGTATGVQHAHRNDVVHADINPSNIFITDAREIKLLDFGVARMSSEPEQSEEDRFAWVTQSYASPEVLSGLPPVVEDDVFSLACVVYRLLRGRHPFGGRLSLIAKHKGLSVEPIAGLPEKEWEILRQALSYERSERPGGVDEFVTWGESAAGDESVHHPPGRFMPTQGPWLAAIAAVVVLAGGLWLYQGRIADDATVPAGPALPEEAIVAEPAISAGEALVIAATQALDDGQLVEPVEVNARALFRAALVLEPDSAEALLGLRTISDSFVQQAQEALNGDDPIEANAALAVATETDPANPAIGIVEQLLREAENVELTEARPAAMSGSLDLAAEVAPSEELLDAIDVPREPAAEVEAAGSLPDVVDNEAETADAAEIAEAPSLQLVDEQSGGASDAGDVESLQVTEEQPDNTVAQLPASEPPVPEEAAPEAATTPVEQETRRRSLQELGVTRYTAPKFPLRALRRNVSGMVEVRFVINTAGRTESVEILRSEPGDVFSESAVNAIDQWRFETRERPMKAQITLRFDQE